MKALVIGLIRFYRNYLSFMHLRCCRFYPSCSEYAVDAVDKYGVVLGLWKGLKRLCRCHPFSAGGYDPLI
ncbi:MAG: membrane protein insertion efficiency factor YidD [Candidatus Omnitrophica bacterium]|nr:membrane protein insertion efficiency factor YidD [Candidatus Omnitrophota bacterium]